MIALEALPKSCADDDDGVRIDTGVAQDGGIAGTVTDNTGGVLPGVTVEAAVRCRITRVRDGVYAGSRPGGREATQRLGSD